MSLTNEITSCASFSFPPKADYHSSLFKLPGNLHCIYSTSAPVRAAASQKTTNVADIGIVALKSKHGRDKRPGAAFFLLRAAVPSGLRSNVSFGSLVDIEVWILLRTNSVQINSTSVCCTNRKTIGQTSPFFCKQVLDHERCLYCNLGYIECPSEWNPLLRTFSPLKVSAKTRDTDTHKHKHKHKHKHQAWTRRHD